MRRLLALYSVLAVLLVAACLDNTSPSDSLQARPIAPPLASLSLDCTSGIPNGGVVKITLAPDPQSATYNTGALDARGFTATVWRDDPNTPGIQLNYCYDPSYNSVVWTYTNQTYLDCYPQLFGACGSGLQQIFDPKNGPGVRKAIAQAGTVRDTATFNVN
jgi:hypothetical protein